MDAHTVMEEWEVSPFDGGFEGIDSLRSRGFSGAVEANGTWLFLKDGDPLTVRADIDEAPREGDVDAFEDASGQTHEAPHPAAASLAAMLALDGDVRGQYFSDETPLSTVHDTLSEGGFTGYVELSENVLSGDYFVVYDAGEASYVGYLGPSGRLLTGEEAQSKAEGEVGIYDVVAVRFPTVDLPEPTPDPTPEPEAAPAVGGEDGEDETPEERPDAEDDSAGADADANTVVEESEDEPDDEEAEVDAESDAVESDADDTDDRPTDEGAAEVTERSDVGETTAADAGDETAHAVPSVDPENSGGETEDTPNSIESESTAAVGMDAAFDEDEGATPETEPDSEADGEATAETDADESGGDDTDSEAEARLEALREEYEAELSSLRSELDALRTERDRLRERIAELETDDTRTEDTAGVSLSPAEAFDGTNLFIREGSRGDATLDGAHDGTVDPEALAENLRIEYHTRFEDDGATVDGTAFDAFLRSSVPYAFIEWLTTGLLFEIQSTGTEGSMRHLYDALPEIDRVGFDESIRVGDGQEGREVTFDIVARDRMGDPLVVANIDESRDPTRGEAMEPLITDASDVCEDHETLAAAFAVTSSFFEPDALSTAREATSGSLLSREKYRSYVKLARKNGFHLCLVESREESFHLTVPEL